MFDFIIIGGGIIGLLTAKALLEDGAQVAVVDKDRHAQQATRAAGGILSPLRPWRYSEPVNAISSLSQPVFARLCAQLHEQTGIDPEWTQSGMLVLNDAGAQQAIDWCARHNAPYELLSVEQLRARFPYLKTSQKPALFRGDVATLRPHKLLAALNQALRDQGVAFYNRQAARYLRTKGRRVSGVQADTEITAGAYIICGGAWSGQLLPDDAPQPDIAPVKGQMLCFPPTPALATCMVMQGERYMIPRRDRRVVVGSTREHSGFDAATTPRAFDELCHFARQLCPALEAIQPDAHWSGLRPSSPGGVPYICRVPPYRNLGLNAGHYRNGIVTAPASARLMADIMQNKPSVIDAEPYRLVR